MLRSTQGHKWGHESRAATWLSLCDGPWPSGNAPWSSLSSSERENFLPCFSSWRTMCIKLASLAAREPRPVTNTCSSGSPEPFFRVDLSTPSQTKILSILFLSGGLDFTAVTGSNTYKQRCRSLVVQTSSNMFFCFFLTLLLKPNGHVQLFEPHKYLTSYVFGFHRPHPC